MTNKPLCLACGLALLCLVTGAPAEDLRLRGLAASCAACHGMQGVAPPGLESLAGQPRQELLRKLLAFKNGSTQATLMQQLSRAYTDEQLAQLAAYFSAQPRSPL